MGLDMYIYKLNKKISKELLDEIYPLLDFSIERAKKILLDYNTLEEDDFNGIYYKFYNESYVKKIGYEEFKKELKEKSKQLCDKCNKVLQHEEVLKDIKYKEIAYWRKHWDLNNIFIDLYNNRGGIGELDNMVLFLEEEDIEHVIDICKTNLECDNQTLKRTLNDLKKVLSKVNWETETVFYNCNY